MKKAAFLPGLFVAASLIVSCGGGAPGLPTDRVLASQSVSSPTTLPGLIVINGADDTLARVAEISAGLSPGLMTLSPDRSTLLAFDTATNNIDVVSTLTDKLAGSIQLAGATTSMVALTPNIGYAAVPATPLTGLAPGAVLALNLASPSIADTISVPNAQTVVSNPNGSQLLVFSNDLDTITVIAPPLVNTGQNPITAVVAGFDRPAYALFSADGSTAYVLNCGPECGSTNPTASVQILDMTTLTPGTPILVDGATIGWLNGSTLYVAGTPTASASNSSPNNSCTGETTSATICGRLDTIDLSSMTLTGSAVITNGYHNRIDMSVNGQLFVGSYKCINIGNVNNPQGEVRGCLSIFNTTNGAVVIPPDNGDVTGLQSFTTRYVEYVAEGGNLRVYDTLIDSLLLTDYITTGTITIGGQVVDVKAVDFF